MKAWLMTAALVAGCATVPEPVWTTLPMDPLVGQERIAERCRALGFLVERTVADAVDCKAAKIDQSAADFRVLPFDGKTAPITIRFRVVGSPGGSLVTTEIYQDARNSMNYITHYRVDEMYAVQINRFLATIR